MCVVWPPPNLLVLSRRLNNNRRWCFVHVDGQRLHCRLSVPFQALSEQLSDLGWCRLRGLLAVACDIVILGPFVGAHSMGCVGNWLSRDGSSRYIREGVLGAGLCRLSHCVVVLLLALAIVAMTHQNRQVATLGHHLGSRCGGTVRGAPF